MSETLQIAPSGSKLSVPARPHVIVISGPSGVGKTTVAQQIVRDNSFERVPTVTTRAPRGDERSGVDYHFVSQEIFDGLLQRGVLLEATRYHGTSYGTRGDDISRVLGRQMCPVLVMDANGRRALAPRVPLLSVFLLPAGEAQLRRQMAGRGDTTEQIDRRVSAMRQECQAAEEYDFVITNYDVERVTHAIVSFVEARTR